MSSDQLGARPAPPAEPMTFHGDNDGSSKQGTSKSSRDKPAWIKETFFPFQDGDAGNDEQTGNDSEKGSAISEHESDESELPALEIIKRPAKLAKGDQKDIGQSDAKRAPLKHASKSHGSSGNGNGSHNTTPRHAMSAPPARAGSSKQGPARKSTVPPHTSSRNGGSTASGGNVKRALDTLRARAASVTDIADARNALDKKAKDSILRDPLFSRPIAIQRNRTAFRRSLKEANAQAKGNNGSVQDDDDDVSQPDRSRFYGFDWFHDNEDSQDVNYLNADRVESLSLDEELQSGGDNEDDAGNHSDVDDVPDYHAQSAPETVRKRNARKAFWALGKRPQSDEQMPVKQAYTLAQGALHEASLATFDAVQWLCRRQNHERNTLFAHFQDEITDIAKSQCESFRLMNLYQQREMTIFLAHANRALPKGMSDKGFDLFFEYQKAVGSEHQAHEDQRSAKIRRELRKRQQQHAHDMRSNGGNGDEREPEKAGKRARHA